MEELPLPWPEFREVWREIPGFEGKYEISSNGRLRSWIKIGGRNERGRRFSASPRIRSAGPNTQGYPALKCVRPDGKAVEVCLHRALALAFLGDRPLHRGACHVDGNPANNSVNNLYWGTGSQNGYDRWRHEAAAKPIPRVRIVFRDPPPTVAGSLPLPWPPDRIAWRPIPGMDGFEVSSDGRIRSWRKAWSRKRLAEPAERRVSVGTHGYPVASLPRECDGRTHPHYVHRLLCTTLHGPPPSPKSVCCHLDGDSTNNTVNNLCWGTMKSNGEDRVRHGTSRAPRRYRRGEENGNSKLKAETVREVKRRLARGELQSHIAAVVGIPAPAVSRIATGRTWAHIS